MCPPASGFNGVRVRAGELGDFSAGHGLEVPELNGPPQDWREPADFISQEGATLVPEEGLLRIRMKFNHMRQPPDRLIKAVLIESFVTMLVPSATVHQGRVQHDARHPGGKAGPALELVKLTERRQEAFLHCVLRISRIPRDRHGEPVRIQPPSNRSEEERSLEADEDVPWNWAGFYVSLPADSAV